MRDRYARDAREGAHRAIALAVACVALLLAGCAAAEGRASAQRATPEVASFEVRTVRSSSALGVPLHPSATSNVVSGRVPNGARVRVLAFTPDRRRVEIEGEGEGLHGFVVARYLERQVPVDAPREPSPLDSPEACEAALRGRAREGDAPGRVRVATWNVRWFPDGEADGDGEGGTDVVWLACAIAALRADVVAVQEFQLHARGRAALEVLLAELERRTGARHWAVFDGCPNDGRQHVGFLYREDRLRLDPPRDLPALSGARSACEMRLRPGLLVRAHLRAGGALDLLSVHLDSGVEARDFTNRARAARAIAELVADRDAHDGARGLVVLGDFNTMGCAQCSPRVAAADELASLVRTLGGEGLALAPSDVPCTHIAGGRASALDHAFVLAPHDAAPSARVASPCATACAHPGARATRSAAFFERLSDHCPVVVELGPVAP